MAKKRDSSDAADNEQESVTKIKKLLHCKLLFRNDLLGKIDSSFLKGCSVGAIPLYV